MASGLFILVIVTAFAGAVALAEIERDLTRWPEQPIVLCQAEPDDPEVGPIKFGHQISVGT